MNTRSNTKICTESSTELGRRDGERASLAELADDAYEAVRAINHRTVTRPPLFAPVVYDLLGNLKQLGYALDQALGQLVTCLGASLEITGYEVYEDDGSNPALSVHAAQALLAMASDCARDLAGDLEDAQSQLARQGYRPTTTTGSGAAAGGDL